MKPMLCQKMAIEKAKEELDDSWVLEEKYDGVRGYIEGGKLYDRRGKDITWRFPEFKGLSKFKETYDGEIIAQDGQFNSISGRVHLKDRFLIDLAIKKSPAKFVIWDCCSVGNPLSGRREVLEKTNFKDYDWIEVAPQHKVDKLQELWENVISTSKEGLIAKRISSPYQEGKRSRDWLKIKAFVEIIAVFTKYEDNPRGLTLETTDGKRVVVNGAQAHKVRAEFEKNGEVSAEVQFLPQRDSEAWRFPSFRGLK